MVCKTWYPPIYVKGYNYNMKQVASLNQNAQRTYKYNMDNVKQLCHTNLFMKTSFKTYCHNARV